MESGESKLPTPQILISPQILSTLFWIYWKIQKFLQKSQKYPLKTVISGDTPPEFWTGGDSPHLPRWCCWCLWHMKALHHSFFHSSQYGNFHRQCRMPSMLMCRTRSCVHAWLRQTWHMRNCAEFIRSAPNWKNPSIELDALTDPLHQNFGEMAIVPKFLRSPQHQYGKFPSTMPNALPLWCTQLFWKPKKIFNWPFLDGLKTFWPFFYTFQMILFTFLPTLAFCSPFWLVWPFCMTFLG